MAPERKKNKKQWSVWGAGVHYSWSGAGPRGGEAARAVPVIAASLLVSAAASWGWHCPGMAQPGDGTKGFMRADDEAGRCSGVGATQNMRLWG